MHGRACQRQVKRNQPGASPPAGLRSRQEPAPMPKAPLGASVKDEVEKGRPVEEACQVFAAEVQLLIATVACFL